MRFGFTFQYTKTDLQHEFNTLSFPFHQLTLVLCSSLLCDRHTESDALSAFMTDADLSSGGVNAPFDPFADAVGDDQVVTKGIVHIRLQQRNGRKSLTTIQGLDEKLDLGKLTKAFKKVFCCNGCVVENKELGRIIQLQGDQREKVKAFLADEEIAAKKMIKVHGI